MRQVNIHEAKTHLSRLADEAGAGETIILAKAGKPVARLVPLEEPERKKKEPRKLGFLKGKLNVPDDFDTMFQDEIIKMFEGEDDLSR
jgi:prevent-host-death family protein